MRRGIGSRGGGGRVGRAEGHDAEAREGDADAVVGVDAKDHAAVLHERGVVRVVSIAPKVSPQHGEGGPTLAAVLRRREGEIRTLPKQLRVVAACTHAPAGVNVNGTRERRLRNIMRREARRRGGGKDFLVSCCRPGRRATAVGKSCVREQRGVKNIHTPFK